MFADEPTGNLDSTTSGEILALLRDSVDTLGQTTVMVTHDAHAAAIADRVLFLADGDIVRDLGPSTRARDPRDARGGERAMIAVALKGLAARKVRALLTALAVVIGVSMVSGTFILTDTMQKSFNGLFSDVVGADRRRHQRQGDRQELHQRQRRHDPRIAARQGPRAARGRGRRRRRRARRGQRRRHHRQGRQGRRQGERRRQLRRRQRPLQPAQAQDRQAAARRPARSRSTPAPPTSSTTRSATRSSSRRSASKHTYRITGTVSFGSVDSLGFASIAAWDVKTAQTLLHREGRYDAISVAAKDGTSPAQLVRGDQAAAARRACRSRTATTQAKDDGEGGQRRAWR